MKRSSVRNCATSITDREQAKNLAAEQPERVARMRTAIDAWFATLPQTVDPDIAVQR